MPSNSGEVQSFSGAIVANVATDGRQASYGLYFSGAVRDWPPVASVVELVGWLDVPNMSVATARPTTITALAIHMMRIFLFSSSSWVVIVPSFFG
jgi:hypothetical protein